MNKPLRLRIIELYGTQADFAEMAKVNEGLVSRIVRGRRRLTPEMKEKWSRLLKSNVNDLFGNGGKLDQK